LVGLFHKGDIHGFASIQGPGTQFPIGGAVWRNDLGENWGALGPIGVSQQVRGEGWGGALLSAGLLELKARGTKQCIIDWTTLGEFYGKHGFEKTRLYRSAKLTI
jgi:predicted N-acetyltransferase YhbS